MIVLHIAWTGNEFIIWGEKERILLYEGEGRPPKSSGAPHPFQASVQDDYFTYRHMLYPRIDWSRMKNKDRYKLCCPPASECRMHRPAYRQKMKMKSTGWPAGKLPALTVTVPEFIEYIAAMYGMNKFAYTILYMEMIGITGCYADAFFCPCCAGRKFVPSSRPRKKAWRSSSHA